MFMPAFTSFKYIYTGYQLDQEGNIDTRVYFSIPIELNVDKNTISYLIFPYGATDDEIEEKEYPAL